MKNTYTKEEVLEIMNHAGDASVKLEASSEILHILQTRYDLDCTSISDDMLLDVRMHWRQICVLLGHVTGLIMDASEMLEDICKISVSNEEKEQ